VNRLTQTTGIGAEALTSYTLAFQTNNMSLEQGGKTLEQFNKRLFEAQQGNTQAGGIPGVGLGREVVRG
jgi:hypothetical protein